MVGTNANAHTGIDGIAHHGGRIPQAIRRGGVAGPGDQVVVVGRIHIKHIVRQIGNGHFQGGVEAHNVDRGGAGGFSTGDWVGQALCIAAHHGQRHQRRNRAVGAPRRAAGIVRPGHQHMGGARVDQTAHLGAQITARLGHVGEVLVLGNGTLLNLTGLHDQIAQAPVDDHQIVRAKGVPRQELTHLIVDGGGAQIAHRIRGLQYPGVAIGITGGLGAGTRRVQRQTIGIGQLLHPNIDGPVVHGVARDRGGADVLPDITEAITKRHDAGGVESRHHLTRATTGQ